MAKQRVKEMTGVTGAWWVSFRCVRIYKKSVIGLFPIRYKKKGPLCDPPPMNLDP